MIVRRRWTKEEDETLVQVIKGHPHNRSEAFIIASSILNRTVSAITQRWYRVLSDPESPKYTGCCFTMLGEASSLVNRSVITPKVVPIDYKPSIWYRIKKLLGII